MGHKFQDRVHVGQREMENDEQAPIFLQFLDCVWQIWRQYPTYFEFNHQLLERIADAVFSAEFGTFLGNCDRDRTEWKVYTRTRSLWTYVLDHESDFENPFYREGSEIVLLPPLSSLLRNVTLWSEYYCRGSIADVSPVQIHVHRVMHKLQTRPRVLKMTWHMLLQLLWPRSTHSKPMLHRSLDRQL